MTPDAQTQDRDQDHVGGPSDLELLVAYQHGDTAAVGELHRRHFRFLARLAYLQIEHWADAEEAAAAAIERVVTHAWQFDPTAPGSVRGWMGAIAKHYAVESRRTARWRHDWAVEPRTLGEVIADEGYRLPGWAAPAEHLTDPERAERDTLAEGFAADVAAVIAELAPRERQVVIRLYLHGDSMREVAADLDLALGTVKSAANRARANLRQNLAYLFAHRPGAGQAVMSTPVGSD